jgi:tetratricopeptide (TPR) repeat protein
LNKLNRLDEALVSYNMAIKHNPTDSQAYYNRGVCLDIQNRLDEKIVSYDKAIQYNPTNSKEIGKKFYLPYLINSMYFIF